RAPYTTRFRSAVKHILQPSLILDRKGRRGIGNFCLNTISNDVFHPWPGGQPNGGHESIVSRKAGVVEFAVYGTIGSVPFYVVVGKKLKVRGVRKFPAAAEIGIAINAEIRVDLPVIAQIDVVALIQFHQVLFQEECCKRINYIPYGVVGVVLAHIPPTGECEPGVFLPQFCFKPGIKTSRRKCVSERWRYFES